ncbi:hypothetical protein C8T65DRAFT_701054 [Cerioporus squamosus]|nr:hypothetical protein C8T65DRAFT_701054 [Cerioporus squamosus]
MSSQAHQPATIINGKAVDLPNRDANLPQLFQIPSHSKLPATIPVNNIYIYLEDTLADAMSAKYATSRKRSLPRGTEDGLHNAGYLTIGPGDYVLCRDMWGSGEEDDDDIVMFVPATEVIEPFRNEMDAARDTALGADEDRDLRKARLDEDGIWRGGIAFERSALAVNVDGAERCYTLGQSYQVQRKLTGPSAGAKVEGEVLNHHVMRQEIMQASARVGIATLEAGDAGLCNALREQADCINLPALGDACNYAFPTMQMNIAATQKAASGSGSLANELGGFGVPHADENDSPAGMTVLIANSKLSPGVEPGFFLNVELGIAVELIGFITCSFSGLRQHGGYPPIDYSGADPDPSSYRFVVVCYPPKQMLDGDSSLALGALPKEKLFQMPPEMIHPRYDKDRSTTNNATWITSGPILTVPEAYLQWYYQAQCQQLAFFHRQVSAHSEMRLDLNALSKVFYFEDENGVRTHPKPWDLRPEVANFDQRAEAMRRWDAFKAKKAKLLPYSYRAGRNPVAVVSMPTEEALTHQHTSKSQKRKRAAPATPSELAEDSRSSSSKPAKRQKKGKSRGNVQPGTQEPAKERRKRRPGNAPKDWAELPYSQERTEKHFMRSQPSARVVVAQPSSSSDSYNLLSVQGGSNAIQVPRFTTPDYSMAEDITEGTDNGELDAVVLQPWQQVAEDALVEDLSSSIPHFQPVLDNFNLRGLLEEYDYIGSLTSNLPDVSTVGHSPTTLSQFLHSFSQDDRALPQFALRCAQMWPCQQSRRRVADLYGLILAVERRTIMLSSAMAWYWLTQDCASDILYDASLLQEDPDCLDSSQSWLSILTRDVWLKLTRQESNRVVQPADYFPNCPPALTPLSITRHENDTSPNAVCIQVITLLRHWLNFPTNSELLSAYFVLHLVDVCGGNTDVLLLRGVWRPYKEIKAAVLNMRGQRWSSLRLSHLVPFAEALHDLPIADASSRERACLDRESGLNALVEFFRDLLPLAQGEAPTSAIQQLVDSDKDRYLPFRNLAPTRRAVSGPSGPFHATNIRCPGAFASSVINRALTFNAPAAKEAGNPTFFSNEEDWDAFKTDRNFSEHDKTSLAYFFNVRCYGSAQATRYQGMDDIDVYFSAEKDWEMLLAECGGKVPFLRFFRWAKQQVKRMHKDKHELRLQARLPLVGKLTAFLLAADLSYSGVVETPTVDEVGAIIYKNDLGSRAGLWKTGQLSSMNASQEETVKAFREVVEHFQEVIDYDDQKLVGLDAIMVEHLLCKYQRVHRELPAFKGKHI